MRSVWVIAASVGACAEDARLSWGSLHDSLAAWEAFNFDTDFTVDVIAGSKTLFHFPGESPDAVPSGHEKPRVVITGSEHGLLQGIVEPHVEAILNNKDPGATSGSKSVARSELLAAGGGLTANGLLKATKHEVQQGDKWQVLRDVIDAWADLNFDTDFSFNVGDASGTLFTYTKGKVDMHHRLPGASLSKWPAALTISGLVADGTLSYDDLASKHLSWWTTDPKDTRSRVTLRHLLTFQSGYMSDGSVACASNPYADYLKCAEQLYNASPHKVEPGTKFAYISTHLQFAGAIAVSASGLSPDQIFKKYLYTPTGMTQTTWTPAKNPQFATGITTTGADFEGMLREMLNYNFLGKEILDEMEKDWSAPPVSPSGDGWFGHYSMGHWFECLDYSGGQRAGSSAALSKFCLDEAIPSGPGAYGYYPLLDRKRGYYMQIVLAEDTQCRSEIPEYLRLIAKPLVDAIIEGKPATDEHLLAYGGGLLMREILDIFNYIPPQCGSSSIIV